MKVAEPLSGDAARCPELRLKLSARRVDTDVEVSSHPLRADDDHRSPAARMSAVVALTLRTGGTTANDIAIGRLLARAVEDRDPRVSRAAVGFSNDLTGGANLGQSRKAWEEYWDSIGLAQKFKAATANQLITALRHADWRERRAAAVARKSDTEADLDQEVVIDREDGE